MNVYDLTFQSCNTVPYPKNITVCIVAPDQITGETGVLMCVHGWGGNRFDYMDQMKFAAKFCNVVAFCTEYRQSGFDFDPLKGRGWMVPYDMGFYQMFDVMNSLREVLKLYPVLNRGRIFAYGGSQGGQIAMLSAVYAPNTFAAVYSTSGLLNPVEEQIRWTGRTFTDSELSARTVVDHLEAIRCPIWLDHGTADKTLDLRTNLSSAEEELKQLGKNYTAKVYDGGGHGLDPVCTRFDAFRSTFMDPMNSLIAPCKDDFASGNIVSTLCADRTLVIDWSKDSSSPELFHWEDGLPKE